MGTVGGGRVYYGIEEDEHEKCFFKEACFM